MSSAEKTYIDQSVHSYNTLCQGKYRISCRRWSTQHYQLDSLTLLDRKSRAALADLRADVEYFFRLWFFSHVSSRRPIPSQSVHLGSLARYLSTEPQFWDLFTLQHFNTKKPMNNRISVSTDKLKFWKFVFLKNAGEFREDTEANTQRSSWDKKSETS